MTTIDTMFQVSYPGAFGEFIGNVDALRYSTSSNDSTATLTSVEMATKAANLRKLEAVLKAQADGLREQEAHLAALEGSRLYKDVLKAIDTGGGFDRVFLWLELKLSCRRSVHG